MPLECTQRHIDTGAKHPRHRDKGTVPREFKGTETLAQSRSSGPKAPKHRHKASTATHTSPIQRISQPQSKVQALPCASWLAACLLVWCSRSERTALPTAGPRPPYRTTPKIHSQPRDTNDDCVDKNIAAMNLRSTTHIFSVSVDEAQRLCQRFTYVAKWAASTATPFCFKKCSCPHHRSNASFNG